MVSGLMVWQAASLTLGSLTMVFFVTLYMALGVCEPVQFTQHLDWRG